jgi:pyruvate/2-oxoglutarate dehydrogenase complex dihydrolipoamide dehydrogenase (E3) component
MLGGTCLNRGCIPTKTMIESAHVAHTARTAARLGVRVEGDVQVDLAAVVRRKDDVVRSIRENAYRQVKKNEHLTLVEGEASFVGPGMIEAGDVTLRAERVVINTGARPTIPDIEGLDDVPYLTSRTLLDVTDLPEHLVVVGGGYVGCEFAQMFRRFGCRVTLVQRGPYLLPGEDPAAANVIADVLREEGIDLLLSAEARRVEAHGSGFGLHVAAADEARTIDGTALLIAAGRTPNTDALNLSAAGAEVDERGFVVVDEAYRTTADDVWAIGDVVGGPMYTHSARDDAERLYRHVVKGEEATSAGRNVPRAVFTDPEVASVGLTEEEARDEGREVKIGKHPFTRVARAKAMDATAGFVKLVADAETDKLIGATIVGPHAGELIHELVIALDLGATYDRVGRSLHVHPTLAEGINSAAGGVHRPAGDE